jgi:hypothetical protein
MATPDLSLLDPEQQALVRRMLAAVVDRPDLHANRIRVGACPGGRSAYFVDQRGGGSAFPQAATLPVDVVAPLVGDGWMRPSPDPTTRDAYAFTEHAVGWYCANSRPSEDEVRRRLGLHLYDAFARHGRRPQPFDVPAVAAQLGVSARDLTAQGHVLVAAGCAAAVPAPRGHPSLVQLRLTEPRGVAWAAAGCPPLGQAAPHATVDVRRHARAVRDQARRARAPQGLRERFELPLRRLGEESETPRGRDEPGGEAIATAVSSRELVGPRAGFQARNRDRVRSPGVAAGGRA